MFESRGYCYQRLGEYQKAIDDYSAEITDGRPYYKTYTHRGYCYGEIGLQEEAEKDHKKAAELE